MEYYRPHSRPPNIGYLNIRSCMQSLQTANLPAPFARKYAPRAFEDFFVPPETAGALARLIGADHVSALIVGESGTGKTSMANTMVSKYYEGTAPHEWSDNVRRISVLKDHSVNHYKSDIIFFCQTASGVREKKKVVVIDDVDVAGDAAQVLFKRVVDRYGATVHFILTCTDLGSVLDGIQTRFAVVRVPSPTPANVRHLIRRIGLGENMDVDAPAEEFLSTAAGGISGAVTSMEKIKLHGGPVTYDLVVQLCTAIHFQLFDVYVSFVRMARLFDAINVLYDMFDQGNSLMDIMDSLMTYIKVAGSLTDGEKYGMLGVVGRHMATAPACEERIELAALTGDIHAVVET